MFDHETRSLWNTFEGVPVVGSLAGSDRRLTSHAVVTTTWGEWRSKHPATTVLSLDTGHRRDYSEGAAYRGYFSTDELMFQVSSTDTRLKNKDEVLVMLLDDPSLVGRRRPLAIAASFLQRNRVFHRTFAGRSLRSSRARKAPTGCTTRRMFALCAISTSSGWLTRWVGRGASPRTPLRWTVIRACGVSACRRNVPSGSAGTLNFRTRSWSNRS